MLIAVQINPRTSRAWCVKAALIVTCWVACFYGTFFGLQSFAVYSRPLSDACLPHHEHVVCSQGIRCCGWQQECTAGALQAARLLGRCSAAQGLITGAVLRHRPSCLQASRRLHACCGCAQSLDCYCHHCSACESESACPLSRRDCVTCHAAVMRESGCLLPESEMRM